MFSSYFEWSNVSADSVCGAAGHASGQTGLWFNLCPGAVATGCQANIVFQGAPERKWHEFQGRNALSLLVCGDDLAAYTINTGFPYSSSEMYRTIGLTLDFSIGSALSM